MIIDLFTIIAQIVNFLILVFLLKKLLFNRIISIIDERESEIKKQLIEAEQKEKKADKELKKQRKIREKLELEWENDLARIKQEIQEKRAKMMEEARESVEQSQQEWESAISIQRDAFLKELRKLSCKQILLISKKVLSELANARLEDQLIESFIDQIKSLDEHKKQEFRWEKSKELAGQNGNRVEINSAFPLSEEAKKILTTTVKELIHKDILPIFSISEDLICGIELRSEDKKIGWNMENYLDMLERGLQDIFVESKGMNNFK